MYGVQPRVPKTSSNILPFITEYIEILKYIVELGLILLCTLKFNVPTLKLTRVLNTLPEVSKY